MGANPQSLTQPPNTDRSDSTEGLAYGNDSKVENARPTRASRGERPIYLGELHVDRLLTAVTKLALEVAVLQRRCYELESAAGMDVSSIEPSDALGYLVDTLTQSALKPKGTES